MATTQRPDTITLTLTERAAVEVQKFMAEEKADPATAGLRVGVRPGGARDSYTLEHRRAGPKLMTW